MAKKICRLCLGQFPIYFSLLNSDISQMLETLTSIKVTDDDELSTVTCTKCLLNLKLAFKIQQNILKVDEKLRNNCLNYIEIKVEPNQIITEQKKDIFHTNICDNLCRICGISIDENHMIKHLQEHFQSVQECNDCGETFKNIQEYRQHLIICQQNKIEKTEFYKCDTCDLKFRYASLYNLHMKKHLNNDNNCGNVDNIVVANKETNFNCNICLRTFKTDIELNTHTHNRRECPICNAAVSRNNWSKHVKNHTSGKQICELCGATLKSVESLRVHMTITHSKKCFKCDECNVTFKVHYNYLKHCKSHTGEKDHICDKCGKRFVTKYYLNKHIKLKHLKLRPYICEFCEKAFSSRCALVTHRRQHTNETPYRCEVCGLGFRQNVSLRTHRRSKHNIVEPKTCACRVCGKEFGSQQAIHSHMRLHY